MVTFAFHTYDTDGPLTRRAAELLSNPEVDGDELIQLVRELEVDASRAHELAVALEELDATLERAGCPAPSSLSDELITRAIARVSFAYGFLSRFRGSA